MSRQQKELLIGAGPPGGELDVHDQIGCELVADALRAGFETRVRVLGTSMLPGGLRKVLRADADSERQYAEIGDRS